jgi:hypothetical protein
MTSPYLELPIRPLAVALRHVLKQTDAELGRRLETTEELRIRRRAELVRRLLAPRLVA